MLQPFLDINLNYILAQHRLNVEYYLDSRQEPRMWSFGKQIFTLKLSVSKGAHDVARENLQ